MLDSQRNPAAHNEFLSPLGQMPEFNDKKSRIQDIYCKSSTFSLKGDDISIREVVKYSLFVIFYHFPKILIEKG